MLCVQAVPLSVVARLAYQSLGVVYGDLGTSPLYVFKGIFANVAVDNKDDIIGALSLIIYTLTIIPLIKYVLITLRANDNGEGKRIQDSDFYIYVWFSFFHSQNSQVLEGTLSSQECASQFR